MQTVEVHYTKPEKFIPMAEVSACYLECEGKLLLLLNKEDSYWGVPAGKLNEAETPLQGAMRELFEETAISITQSQIQSIGTLYIRKPQLEYIFHLFQINISTKPKIQLSTEHQNYQWMSREEMEMIPLMLGEKEAYAYYLSLKVDKVNFKIIDYGSSDYNKLVALREEILRKPLGLLFTKEELELEKEYIHIAGFLREEISATALLIPKGEEMQMRQVATKTKLQGRGIGSLLMRFCEEYATKHGFTSIYCHARINAVQFYLNNQYKTEGEPFTEVGILHYKMRKKIHG